MSVKSVCLFSLVLAVALAGGAQAATRTWNDNGPDSFWGTPANWSGGILPTSKDMAKLDKLPGATVVGDNAEADNVPVGTGSSTGALTIAGGTLTTARWLIVGYGPGSNGTINMESGTINVGTHLYVGFDCEEPAVDRLYVSDRERDDGDMWKDAGVELFLNPSGDRTEYRHIMVNALGAVADASCRRVGGVKTESEYGWNSAAVIRTWRGTDRWQAEVAVPADESIGRQLQAGDAWVANFCRNRNISGGSKTDNQLHTWSPFLKRGFHDLLAFGRLRFVAGDAAEVEPLLRNGRFEVPLKGRMVGAWYWPQDSAQRAGYSLDQERFREGLQSQRIEWKDSANPQSLHITQYLPLLESGKHYLLTFWVRAENVRPCEGLTGYRVNHWGGYSNVCFGSTKQENNNQFMPKGGFRDTFHWSKVGYRIAAPKALDPGARPYIRLSLVNATGTVWYDDVRLRETTAEGELLEAPER